MAVHKSTENGKTRYKARLKQKEGVKGQSNYIEIGSFLTRREAEDAVERWVAVVALPCPFCAIVNMRTPVWMLKRAGLRKGGQRCAVGPPPSPSGFLLPAPLLPSHVSISYLYRINVMSSMNMSSVIPLTTCSNTTRCCSC